MDTKETMTVKEAAEFLGVGEPTISRYLRFGIIQGERQLGGRGRRYNIDAESVRKVRTSGASQTFYTCNVPGCNLNAMHNSGRCSKHEKEYYDAKVETRPDAPLCKWGEVVEECDVDSPIKICHKKAQVQGFCRGHYVSVRYSKDYEHFLREGTRAHRCMVPSCEDPQFHGGLCRAHNQKVRVAGSLEDVLANEVEIEPLTDKLHEQFRLWRTLKGETLQDIAERLGVTRERVRQIENKLYARMKRSVEGGRQTGHLSGAELKYLQTTEFPIERLIFGDATHV